MAKATRKPVKKMVIAKDVESVKESVLKLSESQLRTLDLFEARTQMQHVVMDNLTLKANALSADYRNQMATFKAQQRSTSESLQKLKHEHNQFVSSIESDLGISLKEYSVEPDGYLTYNPLPDEPPPPLAE